MSAACDECGAGLPEGAGFCEVCSPEVPVFSRPWLSPESVAVEVEVDLAQEGRAISEILTALGGLPGQSLNRVLNVVRSLVPLEVAPQTHADVRSARIQTVVDTFGTGPDEDVP